MRCKIKKFDTSNIKPGRIILIIGKRGCGKSTLLRDLLCRMKDGIDFSVAMTPTADSASMFRSHMPDACVYDRFVQAKVDKIVAVAKECNAKGKPKNFALVLDDCMYDKNVVKGVAMRTIFFNGRHFGLTFINIMQYVMDLSPDLRTQVDYVFALKENIIANRIKLWKYFFGMFSHFDDFSAVMDRCTNNFECLCLDNTVNSTSIQDCVSWYKADTSLGDFQIGRPVYFSLEKATARSDAARMEAQRRGAEELDDGRETKIRGRSKLVIDKEEDSDDEGMR